MMMKEELAQLWERAANDTFTCESNALAFELSTEEMREAFLEAARRTRAVGIRIDILKDSIEEIKRRRS